MLDWSIIAGTILMAIGVAFTIYGIGGRTTARLIPLGIFGRIFKTIYVSIPIGAALIVIGALFLRMTF